MAVCNPTWLLSTDHLSVLSSVTYETSWSTTSTTNTYSTTRRSQEKYLRVFEACDSSCNKNMQNVFRALLVLP
ncbi:hypothetical protein PC121_g25614 [Phytophthora cactorum]|nr:hypothetical protein PC121_g25614 [Phytophthora cactorum]KAG4037377.1 hypothetical protein PC123_g27057 [Phytophthora cactorum]